MMSFFADAGIELEILPFLAFRFRSWVKRRG